MMKWMLLILISIPAHAYNFTIDFQNGFYWANLPISITVTEGNANRKQKLENLSRNAIAVWENSTRLKIWDYVGSGTRNVIRWSTNFEAETGMNSATTLAVAIRYTSGPYFAKTEIVLNGNHPMLDDSVRNTDSAVYKTLIHELGHTMGLDHNSIDQSSVMYPALTGEYFNGLAYDDVNGMQAAHQQMSNWQLEGHTSPLAYENSQVSTSPVSCASAGMVAQGSSLSTLLSVAGGILISFIRRLKSLFKKHS